MKIGIFRTGDSAQDYYRATIPLGKALEAGKLAYAQIWIANLLHEVANETKTFWDAMRSDIYLVQRLSSDKFIERVRTFAKESGLTPKIVMDHDDDVFNVSPLSQHYGDFGLHEIKIAHQGVVLHEWKNGVNMDIKLNQKRIDDTKLCIEQSDLITVTTEKLAEVFRPFNANVKVLPNCIDLSQWNRLPIKRENPNEIRLCWSGGYSHLEDLFMIRKPLIEIGKKYPNVKIVMVGYMPKGMDKNFREGQVEFHPWGEPAAHPYRMATIDADIAMIPLMENSFNQAKSPIKWVEFAALKVPSVTSYVPPYDVIQDSDDVEKGIFIDKNDPDGWFNGLEMLISNEELRRTIGNSAREFVKLNYDAGTQYHRWVDVYKEVLCQSPVTQRS